MALTRRQREVLEVIRTLIEEHGYSPSLQEIGRELGLSSVATVHKHVSHLVAKGFARRSWNQNRSIELTHAADGADAVAVPVRGTVSAGAMPRFAEALEAVRIPGELARTDAPPFALRVEGAGFERDQVRDGDLLLLEERRETREGETALVILDGGARLERLDASTPGADTSSASVVGVLVGLVRRYAARSDSVGDGGGEGV